MSSVVLRRLRLRFAGVCAALLAGAVSCHAGDDPRFESYVTADYSGRAAGLASSTVWSVFGPLDQPGFRLKADSFGSVYGDTNANVFSTAFMAADLKMLSDVLAGYQLQWDRFSIKLYGGGAYQRRARIFWQYGRIVPLQEYGAAAAIESFWRGEGRFWASADVSWLQVDNTASFYERVGYEAIRMEEGLTVSGGAEMGAILKRANIYRVGRRLDDMENFVKGGALLNLRYFSHELTLSAGLEKTSGEAEWRPYATLSYGKKF
jgi:hypothetical protein